MFFFFFFCGLFLVFGSILCNLVTFVYVCIEKHSGVNKDFQMDSDFLPARMNVVRGGRGCCITCGDGVSSINLSINPF